MICDHSIIAVQAYRLLSLSTNNGSVCTILFLELFSQTFVILEPILLEEYGIRFFDDKILLKKSQFSILSYMYNDKCRPTEQNVPFIDFTLKVFSNRNSVFLKQKRPQDNRFEKTNLENDFLKQNRRLSKARVCLYNV